MELELKLRLDEAARSRWRERLQQQGGRETPLRAVYFDTADGRLVAAGASLRLRLEGAQWVQTAKMPGDGVLKRFERACPVRGDFDPDAMPTLDLALLAGSPLVELLEGSDAALQARFEVTVARLALRVVTADGTEAEIALDSGHIVVGDRRQDIAELEIEHLHGPAAGVLAIALDIAADGGAWIGSTAKATRGARLADGDAMPAAVHAQPLELPGDAGGHALLRAVLLNALAQVLPNAESVAEGSTDADVIHQARVGLRRLRTALRELAPLHPDMRARWDDPLSEVFSVLGQQRDDEAVAAAVEPVLVAAGAPHLRWTAQPKPDPAQAVRAPAFQQALLEILRLAYALGDAPEPTPHAALVKLLARRLDRLARRVRKEGRDFDKLESERQHSVRKRVKRLRYLAEFVRPLFPRSRVDTYVAALKPVQDALGTHNDVVVAAQKFADDASAPHDSQFAAGYLRAYREITARQARQALRKLAGAKPFWGRKRS